MAKYKRSPVLTLVGFPWITKPDTKFNAEGLFHATARGKLSNPKVQAYKDEIDAAAKAAFEAEAEKMTPKEKKEYQLYLPYSLVETDDGVATGEIDFEFKQNASIKSKETGEVKSVKIGLRDAQGDEIPQGKVAVFGGSTGAFVASPRPIKMSGLKKAGVRLDFAQFQIAKLAERKGGGDFGALDQEDVGDGGYDYEGGTPLDQAEEGDKGY